MNTQRPSDFTCHEDWLAYVRAEVPERDRDYVLGWGRFELFRHFYQARGISLPVEFVESERHIRGLTGAERVAGQEKLNDLFFADLLNHLAASARGGEQPADNLPVAQIPDLYDHLGKHNAYFALWLVYKNQMTDGKAADGWRKFLLRELKEADPDVEFGGLMPTLDLLLRFFQDQKLALPKFAFERIWFLHALRGAERVAQARAVLTMLLTEMDACTSA
jgi:hypothetical protein